MQSPSAGFHNLETHKRASAFGGRQRAAAGGCVWGDLASGRPSEAAPGPDRAEGGDSHGRSRRLRVATATPGARPAAARLAGSGSRALSPLPPAGGETERRVADWSRCKSVKAWRRRSVRAQLAFREGGAIVHCRAREPASASCCRRRGRPGARGGGAGCGGLGARISGPPGRGAVRRRAVPTGLTRGCLQGARHEPARGEGRRRTGGEVRA